MSTAGRHALGLSHTAELSRRRWRVLVIVSIGVFLAGFDSSVLAVALPVIASDLQLTFSGALWVQASYLLVITILLIPAGRWAERRGPYYVYWLGLLLLGVVSVAVALSFNGPFLIVARVFQGIGGALIMTTTAAIVTAVFPSGQRGRALGLNMMATTLGLTLGPPLGGLIVTHMGWPWIFLVKVPVVVATLVAGWDLLGAERRDRAAAQFAARLPSPGAERSRMDIRGTALLGMLLTALFVPLISSPLWGWDSWRTIAPLSLVIILAALFVYVEGRTRNPILDLNLFRSSRVFTAANTACLLHNAASHGVTIFIAVLLEVVQGRSAQVTGLILLIQPGVMTIVTPVAGRLSDRLGSRGLSALGMLVTAAGTVQLALLSESAPSWQVVAALAALGAGLGIFRTPNFSAIMGSVDRSELGVASGLFATMCFCGMGISIAILGAIAASELGPEGGRVVLLGASAGVSDARAFLAGYREAMLVGTGFAVIGALVSLVRERPARIEGLEQTAAADPPRT